MGSRRRLALAFGTTEADLLKEVRKRIETPIAPIEVSSAQAPVHDIVLTGAMPTSPASRSICSTARTAPPIFRPASISARSYDGGKRNVGYRRLMLRGRRTAGMDLVAPSDLRALYAEFVKRKERMPIAFAVGSHPADSVAATCTWTAADEVEVMGAMRGAAVPLVRCATIDAMAPADAEMILEGYLGSGGLDRAGRPLWRVPRLLRAPEDQSDLQPDRNHDAARRLVSDRDDRRTSYGIHGHGAAQRGAHGSRRLGGADDRRARTRRGVRDAGERRRLQPAALAAAARCRRSAQCDRRRARIDRRGQACVRGGRGHRYLFGCADGVGARDPVSGRPGPGHHERHAARFRSIRRCAAVGSAPRPVSISPFPWARSGASRPAFPIRRASGHPADKACARCWRTGPRVFAI